jgi:ankyrin repeat protein
MHLQVRDEYGNTILVIACQNGNKRIAKAVLRRGADINARNYRGNTPLHYCYT